jgi:hypothetical protein
MRGQPCGLLVVLLLPSCGPAKQVPLDRTSVDSLERALAHELLNTVLSTPERGDSFVRYALDEREVFLYGSFATYLLLTVKQQGCKSVSTHCVRCPTGRTYCTNTSQWLAAPHPGP